MWSTVTPEEILTLAQSISRRYSTNPTDREDLAADAVLHCCERARYIDQATKPRSAAARIIQNACIDRLRAQRPEVPLLFEVPTDRTDPATFVDQRIDLERWLDQAGAGIREAVGRKLTRAYTRHATREQARAARRAENHDTVRIRRAVARLSPL